MSAAPIDPSDDLRRQLDETRRELAKAKAEAAEARKDVYALIEHLFPYKPLTPEEVHDMMHGPRGRSLDEIISELEQEIGERS